jgi:hypothetical protein
MTQSITVCRWSCLSDEALSEAAVRARFPSEKYRVSVYRYRSKTRFGGVMRRGSCHVLAGACRYVFATDVTIQAGEVAELPGGDYSFEVLGEDELVIVLCWELPFEFNHVQ